MTSRYYPSYNFQLLYLTVNTFYFIIFFLIFSENNQNYTQSNLLLLTSDDTYQLTMIIHTTTKCY